MESLGEGGSAVVKKVKHKVTGQLYALKQYNGAGQSNFDREVEIFSKLESPNIVKCHAVSQLTGKNAILMDYMDGGSLRNLINQKMMSFHDESVIADLANQLLNAMHHIHGTRIAHLDIKPENILMSNNGIKLCDFGISEIVDADGMCASKTGTAAYMSPERFDSERFGPVYGFSADTWSFGMTIMELYLGHHPLRTDVSPAINDFMIFVCDNDIPALLNTASGQFQEFLGCCLQKDSKKRWTVEQLLSHPFIVAEDDSSQAPPTKKPKGNGTDREEI